MFLFITMKIIVNNDKINNMNEQLSKYILRVFRPYGMPETPKKPKKEPPFSSDILSAPSNGDFIVEDSFVKLLFYYVDLEKKDDVYIYKKAGIDRKLFSKMKSDYFYHPSKDTAFKFCFALELSLSKSKKLLAAAGFAISHANIRDIIFEYCLRNSIYDFQEINSLLLEHDIKDLL